MNPRGHDDLRVAPDSVTLLTGTLFWDCLVSSVLLGGVIAIIIFLFLWQRSVRLVEKLIAIVIGLAVIILIRLSVSASLTILVACCFGFFFVNCRCCCFVIVYSKIGFVGTYSMLVEQKRENNSTSEAMMSNRDVHPGYFGYSKTNNDSTLYGAIVIRYFVYLLDSSSCPLDDQRRLKSPKRRRKLRSSSPDLCENGKTIMPKVPVYIRVQLQIVLQSQKVNDAVKSIESQLKKLREINSKGFPMAATYGAETERSVGVAETDEEIRNRGGR